jgi:hypothetical protein
MEACPPYWEKEETGKVKVGGMESVSGPNPSHYLFRGCTHRFYCRCLEPGLENRVHFLADALIMFFLSINQLQ